MTRPELPKPNGRIDCRLTAAFTASTKALSLTLLLAVALFALPAAQAQTFTVLHTFSGPDGLTPYSGVTLDSAGNLYGTTYLGGSNDMGTVYQLKHHGASYVYNQLYSFINGTDGGAPYGGVIF